MNEKKLKETTKQVEEQLQDLIKIKLYRIISESMNNKEKSKKWKAIIDAIETIQPGTTNKIQKMIAAHLPKTKGG